VEPLISLIQNGETANGTAVYQALAAMGDVAQPRLQAFLLDALQTQNLKVIAACYDFYVMRGDPAAEPALISAMNFYADAYGNYDDNGMVAIAERFLNCGNDNLHAAAIGWGESHAFQVEVTPCPEVTRTWGPDVHYAYCGPGMVTWGNEPLTPTDVYVLFRYANDATVIGFGGFRSIFASVGGPYSPPAYRGQQDPNCPNVMWKVDTLTSSAGTTGAPVVYTGDSAMWKITIASGNPPLRGDLRIKFAVDGTQIYTRDVGVLGRGAAIWVPSRGWNSGDEEKLHTVTFELDYAGAKCDSQSYQFSVVKRPIQSQQPASGSIWLRPHLIDSWNRSDVTQKPANSTSGK
jgi:hypothetical protein